MDKKMDSTITNISASYSLYNSTGGYSKKEEEEKKESRD